MSEASSQVIIYNAVYNMAYNTVSWSSNSKATLAQASIKIVYGSLAVDENKEIFWFLKQFFFFFDWITCLTVWTCAAVKQLFDSPTPAFSQQHYY